MTIDATDSDAHVLEVDNRTRIGGGAETSDPTRTGDVEDEGLESVDDRPSVVCTSPKPGPVH
jgi:hypothetical protein